MTMKLSQEPGDLIASKPVGEDHNAIVYRVQEDRKWRVVWFKPEGVPKGSSDFANVFDAPNVSHHRHQSRWCNITEIELDDLILGGK